MAADAALAELWRECADQRARADAASRCATALEAERDDAKAAVETQRAELDENAAHLVVGRRDHAAAARDARSAAIAAAAAAAGRTAGAAAAAARRLG